jgi:hypothetical protein
MTFADRLRQLLYALMASRFIELNPRMQSRRTRHARCAPD